MSETSVVKKTEGAVKKFFKAVAPIAGTMVLAGIVVLGALAWTARGHAIPFVTPKPKPTT